MNLRDLQGVESTGLDQLAFEGRKGGMEWKVAFRILVWEIG